MRNKPAFLIFIILSFVLFSLPAHPLDIPKLQGYVNDYANMISPSVKAELENELRAFEQTDSTQIVILTVPSLEGEVIEDFSIKVAEAWKIGQKGKDNGIIFIVAKQERKMRIEVGRGLEGKLTDLMAGRIKNLVVNPRFKREDFDGGFTSGVSSLIDATRGEFKADGNHRSQKHETFLGFLMFGAILMLVLGSISRILSGIAGAIGLPALVSLTLFQPGLIGLIIFAFLGLGAGLFLPFLFSSGGHYRGGGFWPGGFSGTGSGSGGGDFGGGFSGGGGDFGGGGASGDW